MHGSLRFLLHVAGIDVEICKVGLLVGKSRGTELASLLASRIDECRIDGRGDAWVAIGRDQRGLENWT